jgi:hypothetical protein
MNDAQREALQVLAEVWMLSPDVRLGQLMAHLGFLGEVHAGQSLGDIEDDALLAILYRHRGELQNRTAQLTEASVQPLAVPGSVSGSPTVSVATVSE